MTFARSQISPPGEYGCFHVVTTSIQPSPGRCAMPQRLSNNIHIVDVPRFILEATAFKTICKNLWNDFVAARIINATGLAAVSIGVVFDIHGSALHF